MAPYYTVLMKNKTDQICLPPNIVPKYRFSFWLVENSMRNTLTWCGLRQFLTKNQGFHTQVSSNADRVKCSTLMKTGATILERKENRQTRIQDKNKTGQAVHSYAAGQGYFLQY